MSNHAFRPFLLRNIFAGGEDNARLLFAELRWQKTGGKPSCPRCSCTAYYYVTSRKRFACVACEHQYTVTSGTAFQSRKMKFCDILACISIMAEAPKGSSSLSMGRTLGSQQKSAFVLMHKIREAMRREIDSLQLSGEIELDGGYFLGHLKQRNHRRNVQGRMQRKFWSGKRRCVIVLRERAGRVKTYVELTESAGVARAVENIASGSTIFADGARHWNKLAELFEVRRINHSLAYAIDNHHTNWAESFLARLRSMVRGQHHRGSPEHLREYAAHAAWLENHRKETHIERVKAIFTLISEQRSSDWVGYWQGASERGQRLASPKWGTGHSREFSEKREAWTDNQ